MELWAKIALVSAMAVSTHAMALQSMDDDALSTTTGQDGITVKLNTTAAGISIDHLYLHDNDGLAPVGTAAIAGNPGTPASADYNGGTATAGAIGIHGVKLTTGALNNGVWTAAPGTLATVKIDTDAGAASATDSSKAFLNVGVQTGAVNVALDSITVGASGTQGTTDARRGVLATGTNTTGNKIVSGYTDTDKLNVTVGGSKLNIQLGNTPQGAMIVASGNVTGGLNLSNVALVDKAGGGVIGVDGIRVTDASSNDLTANARISIVNNNANESGLKVTLGNNAQDVYMSGVRLGGNYTTSATAISDATNVGTSAFNAASIAKIGDLELQGLNLNSTSVMISGH